MDIWIFGSKCSHSAAGPHRESCALARSLPSHVTEPCLFKFRTLYRLYPWTSFDRPRTVDAVIYETVEWSSGGGGCALGQGDQLGLLPPCFSLFSKAASSLVLVHFSIMRWLSSATSMKNRLSARQRPSCRLWTSAFFFFYMRLRTLRCSRLTRLEATAGAGASPSRSSAAAWIMCAIPKRALVAQQTQLPKLLVRWDARVPGGLFHSIKMVKDAGQLSFQ